MLSKRIIPCLDIKDGRVVKGVNFINLTDAGDAIENAIFYESEGADELTFLDITASADKRKIRLELVRKISENLRIPFTVGGGISEISDIEETLKAGADKITLNTAAVENPSLISEGAKRFGSQAIVLAIDYKKVNGIFKVFTKGGRVETSLDAFNWCLEAVNRGAGEILATSMDKDGTQSGYDLDFLSRLRKLVKVPIIASGGAGNKEHFLRAFKEADVSACLAASLFHFRTLSISDLKLYLKQNEIKVRI